LQFIELSQHLRIAVPTGLIKHRELINQMVRREIEARYRGSVLGVLWSFATPLLMLGIFTFVFSVVFTAKWGQQASDPTQFALMLFPGMILHGFMVEILGRAPTLIVSNANFVKKIVFPLDVLPAVAVGSALFQALIGLAVVALFKLLLTGSLPPSALWLPAVIAPFVVFLAGLAWLLSSLGVYLRDLSQVTGVLGTALMFLSPVFYPIEALPPEWRPWVHFNPLTLIIEQTRAVLVLGESPDGFALLRYTVFALVFAGCAFYWFQRSRKGFADVL
jgi:lipopolysaccharide transport system permease protein